MRYLSGRRAWVISLAGALFLAFVAGLGTGVFKLAPVRLVEQSIDTLKDIRLYASASVMNTPNQHLGQRRQDGDGVQVVAPGRMQPGLTFMTGLFGTTLGFRLYAADGTLVHEWPVDFFRIAPDEMKHRFHALIHGAHLYRNGDVVANLDGRGLVRIDRCGKTLWQNRDGSHHSVFVDQNGDIWTPTQGKEIRDPLVSAQGFTMDHVARFDAATGQKLEDFALFDVLRDSDAAGLIQFNGAKLGDVVHLNDVEVLTPAMAGAFPGFAAGDILLSLRNLNQIWILDGGDQRLKWWFAGPMLGQHDPDFQPDGTITVLDNRPSGPPTAANGFKGDIGGSRILAIRPDTQRALTHYESRPDNVFFTPYRGKHEVLPNGNILIAETDAGRAFEVTSGGDLVWSFVNGWDKTHVGWLMDAVRYPSDYADIAKTPCN